LDWCEFHSRISIHGKVARAGVIKRKRLPKKMMVSMMRLEDSDMFEAFYG